MDAVSVLDQRLGGRPDPILSEVCRQEGRALVTLDLDFADINAYPPAEFAGFVVLRPTRQDKTRILGIIRRLTVLLEQEPLAGRLWIVDDAGIRIRG